MKNPNALQKLTHRFLMLPAVSGFLAVTLYRVDSVIMDLTHDRYSITEIVGLPIIRLTTRGAKSGQLRSSPLVGLIDGDKIALIASNFGWAHNPAWYHNLKAHPECSVQYGGRARDFRARQAEGPERQKYLDLGASYYSGYRRYEARAAPRIIPVMVLEPL